MEDEFEETDDHPKIEDGLTADQRSVVKAIQIFQLSRPLAFYGSWVLDPDSIKRLRSLLLASSALNEAQAEEIVTRAGETLETYRAALSVVSELPGRRRRWVALKNAARSLLKAAAVLQSAGDLNSAAMLGLKFRDDLLALRSLAAVAGGEAGSAFRVANAMTMRLSGNAKHGKLADRWLILQLIVIWRSVTGSLPPDTRQSAKDGGATFQKFVAALTKEATEPDGQRIVRSELGSMIQRTLAVLRSAT